MNQPEIVKHETDSPQHAEEVASTAIRHQKMLVRILEVVTAAFLTTWYYRHLIPQSGSHLLDVFDHRSLIYIMEWSFHCLFGTGSLRDIFNLNIFFPHTNTLAWSDTLLGFLPGYSIIRLLVPNPILAFNICHFTLVFIACLGCMSVGRQLTGRFSPISALVGAVGLIPAGQEGHFQMKALALFIWLIFVIVKYFKRPSPGLVAWAAVLVNWLFLCNVYLTIITAVLVASAVTGGIALRPRATLRWTGELLRNIVSPRALIFCFLSIIPSAIVLRHYLQVKQALGTYAITDAVTYAGRLLSFFDAPQSSFLYKTLFYDWGYHEARLFAGIIPYLFAIFIVLSTSRKNSSPAQRATTFALFAAAVWCGLLALGPYQKELFLKGIHLPLPAAFLGRWFPGYSVLRTPGRFGLPFALCLGWLTEIGVRRMIGALAIRPQQVAYFAVTALLFLEQTTIHPNNPVVLIPKKDFYSRIDQLLPPNAVLAELPMVANSHLDTMSWIIEQELASTIHWRKLIVGYSSNFSPEFSQAIGLYQAAHNMTPQASELFVFLKKLGVTHLVLHTDRLGPDRTIFIEQQLANSGYPTKLFSTPTAEVYGE